MTFINLTVGASPYRVYGTLYAPITAGLCDTANNPDTCQRTKRADTTSQLIALLTVASLKQFGILTCD